MKYWRKLGAGHAYLWPLVGLWLLLLPAHCILQWHRLNRLRDADRDQMQRNLADTVGMLRDAFDRLPADAYHSFRLPADADADLMADRFRAALKSYQERTDQTNLITALYWVADEDATPRRFLPWNNTLAPVGWPSRMANLRQAFDHRLNAPRHNDPPGFDPEAGVLVVPAQPGPTHTQGWVLVQLNTTYLLKKALPDLAARHLQAGPGIRYNLALAADSDPEVPLYLSDAGLTLNAFASCDLRTRVFSTRLVTGRAGKPAGPDDQGAWQLLVKHRAGSLTAAANAARNREAVLMFSMTGLLALGMFLPLAVLLRNKQTLAGQLAFFSGLSHDLRAPLSVISSAAFNLSRAVVTDADKVRRYGGLIRNESARLQDMVDQVLEFSRAQAGAGAYFMEPQDAAALVTEVVEAHGGLLEKHHMEVSLLADKDLPSLWGDARALKSAIGNLITNAVKYGNARGWMGVRVYRDGRRVCIEVADRGDGIPAAEQARLFEPYYRAASARQSTTEGSGLGLSMVRKIIKRHGGTVTLRSAPGEGAAFCISLPPQSPSQSQKAHGGLPAWKKRFSW